LHFMSALFCVRSCRFKQYTVCATDWSKFLPEVYFNLSLNRSKFKMHFTAPPTETDGYVQRCNEGK